MGGFDTVGDATLKDLDCALALVTIEADLYPDRDSVPGESSWDALVAPPCTALIVSPVRSTRSRTTILDKYGLPDFDSLDFGEEPMAVEDIPP